jgi:hypothetical protein
MNKATDDAGCADPPGDWNNDTTPVDTYSGGDHESRPVNKYVFHIIKAYLLSPERTYIQPPVGTIIPFAGQKIVSSNWILCDGRSLSTRGDYKELYAAIGYAHGQAGTEEMVLPDYRGYFLRTVDQGKQGDPDAKSRTVPYPSGSSGQQGNAGDDVGSRQGSATGLPHKPFRTSLLHLPTSSGSKRVAGLLWQLAEVNGGSEDVTMTQSGGDAESRPANLAVDWLIRFK